MRIVWIAVSFMFLSTAAFADGDVTKGAVISKRCIACHSVKDAANKIGPSLVGVVGRNIATAPGYAYSPAMVAYGATAGVWDDAKLDAYLTDPKAVVPGTKMALAPIKKPEDRVDLIAYLKSLAP